MNPEIPKTDTEYDDQAIKLANSAKQLPEVVDGQDATILDFPSPMSDTSRQAGDTLIQSYAKSVADKQSSQKPEVRLTFRGRVALALGGVAALVGLGVAVHEATDTDFHGEKTVKIDENTVTDIANNEVDGGASHTADTVNKIVAMNPDVFQDGKAFVDSEDMGKDITVPEKAE